MSKFKERHPALKHGAYSATALLPGENPAEFKKLHESVIAEFAPLGAIEEDIVATIARLMWRKQNLAIFRIAKHAQNRYCAIESEKLPSDFPVFPMFEDSIDPAPRALLIRAAKDEARKELGEDYKLVEVGEIATIDCLMKDLEVEERLNGMIDKCVVRLLRVRGVKSMVASPPTTQQQIGGPKRAAATKHPASRRKDDPERSAEAA